MPPASRGDLVVDLIPFLAVSDAVQASWAADALKIIGPAAVRPMIDFMGQDENGANYAVMALAKMRSTAVPALAEILRGSDADARYHALLALREMGQGDAAGAVREVAACLTDPDETTRQLAAATLGYMYGAAAPAVNDMIRALRDEKPAVRDEVTAAFGKMGAVANPAVPHLVGGLSDSLRPLSPEFVRGTLDAIGTPPALSALQSLGVDQPNTEKYETRHSNSWENTRQRPENRFKTRQTTRRRATGY